MGEREREAQHSKLKETHSDVLNLAFCEGKREEKSPYNFLFFFPFLSLGKTILVEMLKKK